MKRLIGLMRRIFYPITCFLLSGRPGRTAPGRLVCSRTHANCSVRLGHNEL